MPTETIAPVLKKPGPVKFRELPTPDPDWVFKIAEEKWRGKMKVDEGENLEAVAMDFAEALASPKPRQVNEEMDEVETIMVVEMPREEAVLENTGAGTVQLMGRTEATTR